MAFATQTVANEILSVMNGLSGMGSAQIGAPESVGPQVMGYVTMGGFSTERALTGIEQKEQRYFCMFAYRVDGAETTAETTLMTLVDAFVAALLADLTLNGSVRTAQINASAADEPEYQLRAGKEYREYPIVITVTQRDSYTVNP